MPDLRVLMTTDTIGGVWTYAIELARACRAEVEVTLATMGPPVTPKQRAEADMAGVQLFESEFKLEWMRDPWEDVERAGAWLLKLASLVQPDVIHLNNFVHGALPWPAPVLVVGHSCVYSWWHAVHGSDPPPEWRPYGQAVGNGLRRCDCVAAPGDAMLQALQRHYGPFERAAVVPNGRSRPNASTMEKQPFIMSAGRLWDKAKNIEALNSVAGDLAWPIRVAGDTDFEHSALGDLLRLHMLGRLETAALARQMAAASIYALPARYEPFGLSILEAALSHCALVLGDIPSLREIWEGAALFVPPDDPDALRETLQYLIQDRVGRARLSGAAHARAVLYSPAAMGRGYLNLYRSLLRPVVPGTQPTKGARICM